MTMPGNGPMRGGMDFSFLDDALNSSNAFTPVKREEQLKAGGPSRCLGTIMPNKTSFSFNAGSAQYTSPNLHAVMPERINGQRHASGSRATLQLQRPLRSRD